MKIFGRHTLSHFNHPLWWSKIFSCYKDRWLKKFGWPPLWRSKNFSHHPTHPHTIGWQLKFFSCPWRKTRHEINFFSKMIVKTPPLLIDGGYVGWWLKLFYLQKNIIRTMPYWVIRKFQLSFNHGGVSNCDGKNSVTPLW